MVNLKRTAAAFFTFWLFAFVCLMTMSMFFRCVGSMGRTLTQVMVPFGVIMIAYITYAGFVIPVSYMQPWLRWVGYINPIAYAFESLMINEVSISQD
jgi:ATP-binding cassette subfamily G (WHITE) protein 2 (PDR)